MKKRVLEHYRAIVHNDANYPVARHVNEFHGGKTDSISYFAIDSVHRSARGGDRQKRLRRLEARYIVQIGTKYPLGLNKDEELAVFL